MIELENKVPVVSLNDQSRELLGLLHNDEPSFERNHVNNVIKLTIPGDDELGVAQQQVPFLVADAFVLLLHARFGYRLGRQHEVVHNEPEIVNDMGDLPEVKRGLDEGYVHYSDLFLKVVVVWVVNSLVFVFLKGYFINS